MNKRRQISATVVTVHASLAHTQRGQLCAHRHSDIDVPTLLIPTQRERPLGLTIIHPHRQEAYFIVINTTCKDEGSKLFSKIGALASQRQGHGNQSSNYYFVSFFSFFFELIDFVHFTKLGARSIFFFLWPAMHAKHLLHAVCFVRDRAVRGVGHDSLCLLVRFVNSLLQQLARTRARGGTRRRARWGQDSWSRDRRTRIVGH